MACVPPPPLAYLLITLCVAIFSLEICRVYCVNGDSCALCEAIVVKVESSHCATLQYRRTSDYTNSKFLRVSYLRASLRATVKPYAPRYGVRVRIGGSAQHA